MLVSSSSASLSRQIHVGHLQLQRPETRCERKNGPRLPKRLASIVLTKRAMSLQSHCALESGCPSSMSGTPLLAYELAPKFAGDHENRRIFVDGVKNQKLLGNDIFSQGVSPQVSSALERFTSVFGMGTGGSTPLKSPRSSLIKYSLSQKEYASLKLSGETICCGRVV